MKDYTCPYCGKDNQKIIDTILELDNQLNNQEKKLDRLEWWNKFWNWIF